MLTYLFINNAIVFFFLFISVNIFWGSRSASIFPWYLPQTFFEISFIFVEKMQNLKFLKMLQKT